MNTPREHNICPKDMSLLKIKGANDANMAQIMS